MRGGDAWLSDAQGDLAISAPVTNAGALPAANELKVGQSYAIDGTRFRVASLTRARYAGVEGELPFTTWDRDESLFADLDTDGNGDTLRFATIDYSDDAPVAYVKTYPLFIPLARLGSIKHAEVVVGNVGGMQLAGVPPSLSDARFGEKPIG